MEAAWVDLDELDGLPLVPGLLDFLFDVGVMQSAESVDLGFEPPV